MRGFTVGSLFAGIGGFDLGFERAGFKTVWQVEINDWCRRVLAKNFPDAERYADIRDCGKHNLKPVDVIVGGFPCQDISNAGLRAGIGGERSGLWSEMHRIIRELQPRFVLVENVAALLGRGMGRVLGDLAEIGYDAEWEIVSAADVGAPHLRERVWIVAYPYGGRRWSDVARGDDANGTNAGWSQADCLPGEVRASGRARDMADATRELGSRTWSRTESTGRCESSNGSGALADAESERCGEARGVRHHKSEERTAGGGQASREIHSWSTAHGGDWWAVEPSVCRVAHGIPARVDRLRGLGNAVVPQIPELYAHRIKQLLEAA